MISENSVELLVEAFRDVQTSRYLAVIAFTAYTYDWLTLLGDEVDLVGKSRLSLGKTLYIFTRFMTMLGLTAALIHLTPELRGSTALSKNFCIIFAYILPVVEVTSFLASYWLLMLRLVALYKSRPYFVYFLYASLIACWVVTYAFLVMASAFFSHSIEYSDMFGLCAITQRAPTLAGVFVAPLFYDILLITLTFYHALKVHRGYHDPATWPLIRVLYRDGVIFSVIMAGIRIWNIIIYAIQPVSRTYLGPYVMWAAITMLSCRIYLNVVQIAQYNARERDRTQYTTPNVDSYNRAYGECENVHRFSIAGEGRERSKLGSILRLSSPVTLKTKRKSGFDVEALKYTNNDLSTPEPARFPRVIGREMLSRKPSKGTINLSIHIKEEVIVTDESGSVRHSIPSVPQTPRSLRSSGGSFQGVVSPQGDTTKPEQALEPLQGIADNGHPRELKRSRLSFGPASPTRFAYPPDSPTHNYYMESSKGTRTRTRPMSDQALRQLEVHRSPTLSRVSVSNPLRFPRRPRTTPSRKNDNTSFLPMIH